MQQSADRKALYAVGLLVKMLFHHRIKNADGVHDQAVFAGAVIARACRRGKEIGPFEPFKQLVRALTRYVLLINLYKLFLWGHIFSSVFA